MVVVPRTAELLVSGCKAGCEAEKAEEARAEELVLMPTAAPWQRLCKEVEESASPWGGAKEKSGRGMCRALFGAGLGGGVEWRWLPPTTSQRAKGSLPCF